MPGTKCVHCGDDCGKYPVTWDEKVFCCNGCLSVYRILSENKLSDYYKYYETPGINIEEETGSSYAYLDNTDIFSKLIDFTDGKTSRVTFYIPAIHCSSCVWLLEHLNKLDKGVLSSSVNFSKKEITIIFKQDEISLSGLVRILASIHYVPKISLDDLERKKPPATEKSLLYKIGIAGFAFGNIMIYTMPFYLPGKEFVGAEFRNVFAWLSFFLSVPVVVYSASDYFLSAWKNLRQKIVNLDLPIAVGVLALFVYSSISFFFHTGEHLYFDSLSGLVFFLLIGKWYQGKTYSALSFERDYKSYFPVAVTRIEGEIEKITPIQDLKPGDRILIRNNELIPTDGVLVKGEAYVDYSFVTGESQPVEIKNQETVYAGGRQSGPVFEMEISNKVEQSRLTRLWNEENYSKPITHKLNRFVDNVSYYFVYAVLTISILTAVYWLWADPTKALLAAISVLIVACPCALALAMPFAFGNAMRLAGKMGFYLKKSDVVEDLAAFDTVVFDKTGTITENNHSVVEFCGDKLREDEENKVSSLVKHSTHPLSVAIYRQMSKPGSLSVKNFKEIPSEGLTGLVDGEEVKVGNRHFVGGEEAGDGQTGSRVYVAINGKAKGYYRIENKFREGLREVLNQMGKYAIHVISGDNDKDAGRLHKIFPENTIFNFNLSPTDKRDYIQQLHKKGKQVVMIGDGLNDAGALRESKAGISIADDIFLFSPASDAILESGSFKWLPCLFRYFRTSLNILKTSYLLSFLYNMVGLYFAVTAQLSPILAAVLMPLSSVSVVLFTTAATSLAARSELKN